ncbi:MAG: glucan 1,4-alpha-glucosidase [Anaerolineaceae bacterium]
MGDGLAPGWPGIAPRWTSSAKSGVGTSASSASRVWFTLSHGIVNEIYFPRVDSANTRDMGFLVADGATYFSEEKRDCVGEVELLAPGVPGFRLRNASRDGRYALEKTVITHPHLDVLLQRVRFSPAAPGQHLYALLAPHIGNRGTGNDGWIGDYKGMPMLFAQRDSTTIAMACSAPFRAMSAGYAGTSDGWQDISVHCQMTWQYDRATDGNIALTAEIDLESCANEFVLAIGFGETPSEAGQVARLALEQGFDHLVEHFVGEWQRAGIDEHRVEQVHPPGEPLVPISLAVLRAHDSKRVPGGFVASLSIPWGSDKGDDDLGGYHLVWPRDLVETAGGLLAAGDSAAARRAFHFLVATQDADGRWPQNMWLDGTPYWSGIQMDEIALPILLADQLRREDALSSVDPWPTVRRAASYIVRNGPVTQQDRWEEDPGYSPFTLAVEIAALVTAADFADRAGANEQATYLRETADLWNASIERWTYASGSDLARSLGIDGYYVRIAPEEDAAALPMATSIVFLKNRPLEVAGEPAGAIVSPDALALVRFGLRRSDDPRIVSTVAAIDATLKTETANGPVWHRYSGDGYGEHEDGSAFDGTGVGRGWPLLAGERGHFELAAGNRAAAEALLETMARQTNDGGLIPEQVWDAPDIPERELFNGKPAGSAMPLAWAHAEYLKLARSLKDGSVFDTPPQAVQRYVVEQVGSNLASWRFNNKCRTAPQDSRLRIETLASATVVWTFDNWTTQASTESRDTGLGVHVADLPTETLDMGRAVEFTFRWHETDTWEGMNFSVIVAPRT